MKPELVVKREASKELKSTMNMKSDLKLEPTKEDPEPTMKVEAGVKAEQTTKTEPGQEAEPTVKAVLSASERADAFGQNLRSIRSAAAKNVQDAKTIQRLMANFITITTATRGTEKVAEARQAELGAVQVERACHAIVGIVEKIVGSAGETIDLHAQLATMWELCAGACSHANVVDKTAEKVPQVSCG
ncbi:hypothetical protein LTR65_005359 [Meristemomyces frigidus]